MDMQTDEYNTDTTKQVDTPGSNIKTVNTRPDDLEEYVDQFHDGGGFYHLPDGSRVHGRQAALGVLRSYFEDRGEVTDDDTPQYICIQHPDMTVWGPVFERDDDGNIKTDRKENPKRVQYKQMVRGREKYFDETQKYGEFRGGKFYPEPPFTLDDPELQYVLENTDYVIKE